MGLPSDSSGQVIADEWSQRGAHGEALLDKLLGPLCVGLDARNAAVDEDPRDVGQKLDRLQQVVHDYGNEDIELELPPEATHRDGRVVPHHLRGHHRN